MQLITGGGKIEVTLVETTCHPKPCHVCGGWTESPIIARATVREGITIDVCEACLKDGRIDMRLATHAAQLQNFARLLLSLAGKLKVPTYEEWKAETERVETAMAGDDQYDAEREGLTLEEYRAREEQRWKACRDSDEELPF